MTSPTTGINPLFYTGFDSARREMLRAFKTAIDYGADAAILESEVCATEVAMRSLMSLHQPFAAARGKRIGNIGISDVADLDAVARAHVVTIMHRGETAVLKRRDGASHG